MGSPKQERTEILLSKKSRQEEKHGACTVALARWGLFVIVAGAATGLAAIGAHIVVEAAKRQY